MPSYSEQEAFNVIVEQIEDLREDLRKTLNSHVKLITDLQKENRSQSKRILDLERKQEEIDHHHDHL
jgi:hypothetical protein